MSIRSCGLKVSCTGYGALQRRLHCSVYKHWEPQHLQGCRVCRDYSLDLEEIDRMSNEEYKPRVLSEHYTGP